jgi:phosphatidylglycerophosphatase C
MTPAGPTAAPVVAAFDFDGTLSTRDNVVPFLRLVAGSTTAATRIVAETSVRLASRGRASWNRDALKREIVARVFAGSAVGEIDDLAREFAAEVTAHHLRPEAVARAEWHRTQGHRLVIVSASFATYLRPVAEQLRFDAVLATELAVDGNGALTGELDGPNVRGAEKARRLDAWLAGWSSADAPPYVFAYGDSSGDRELWARADRAVRLGRRAHRGAQ